MSWNDDELMPDTDRLRTLLVGKKITNAEMVDGLPEDAWGLAPTGVLTLDDGTVLELFGHDGGCACNSGCYELTELVGDGIPDNVITDVQLDESPSGDDQEGDGYYRIFVYTANQEILLASFDGTDGNGYYGTGWYLRVKEKS